VLVIGIPSGEHNPLMPKIVDGLEQYDLKDDASSSSVASF